nr:hypothetical protein [Ralstonia solanacearum]
MTHIDADIATLLRDARWRIANKDTSTDEYKRKQSFNNASQRGVSIAHGKSAA